MNWKQLISAKRFGMEEFHEERQENRSEFQRDYDRLIFRLLSADYRTRRKYSLFRAAFLYTTDLRTVSKSPALAVHSGTMLPKHFWNVIRNFKILSCRRSVLSSRPLAWHTIWVIRPSVIQVKRLFLLFSLKGKEFA